MKNKILAIAGLAISISAASASASVAAPISDQLTVFDGAGAIAQQITLFEDGTRSGGECYVALGGQCDVGGHGGKVYYFPDLAVDAAQLPNYTALLEADGKISDLVGIVGINNQLFLGILSDDDTFDWFKDVPVGPRPITENGQPVDVTLYLAPALQAAGFHAAVFSDVSEVPLPGAFWLLGPALGGLGFMRRRHAG